MSTQRRRYDQAEFTDAEHAAAEALIAAGRVYRGVEVFQSSERHDWCDRAALWNSRTCAKLRRQNHHDFQARYNWAYDAHDLSIREICAESWPWTDRQGLAAIAREMYDAWKQSPGHWGVASSRCDFYGAAMCRSSRGIWYATVIAATPATHLPRRPVPLLPCPRARTWANLWRRIATRS